MVNGPPPRIDSPLELDSGGRITSPLWIQWLIGLVNRREGTASPVGTVTPLYDGEEYKTTITGTKAWWKATGLTNTDWVQIG